jgi:hypothetical protein
MGEEKVGRTRCRRYHQNNLYKAILEPRTWNGFPEKVLDPIG